jgi:hypothetical protein
MLVSLKDIYIMAVKETEHSLMYRFVVIILSLWYMLLYETAPIFRFCNIGSRVENNMEQENCMNDELLK